MGMLREFSDRTKHRPSAAAQYVIGFFGALFVAALVIGVVSAWA